MRFPKLAGSLRLEKEWKIGLVTLGEQTYCPYISAPSCPAFMMEVAPEYRLASVISKCIRGWFNFWWNFHPRLATAIYCWNLSRCVAVRNLLLAGDHLAGLPTITRQHAARESNRKIIVTTLLIPDWRLVDWFFVGLLIFQ